MVTNQLPPPGWYPDPGDDHAWRWWSGTAWTAHTSVRSNTPHTAVAQLSPSRSDLFAEEDRITRLASFAAVVQALAAISSALFNWFNSKSIANFLHGFREVLHQSENGQTTSPLPALSSWSLLFSVVTLATFVTFIVWQYRAARVAQQIGYPSRYSPGFGVAAWIIPLINFWVPYRAVRDLVPNDHLMGRFVGSWWTTNIMGIFAGLGLFIAGAEARTLGAMLLALVIVISVAQCLFQRSIILAVRQCHQQALVIAKY